jgi:REP element-mobilizing transposase RayT
MNASTRLSMNGKSLLISAAPPFVLRFSKDERRLLQQNHYLERVEHYRKRYWVKIYAYVLMSNHVHLLLETSKTARRYSKGFSSLTPSTIIGTYHHHSSRSQVSKELGIELFAMLV